MRPSAKTEKEILHVYETWLRSYLTGDVGTYDSYLDEEYHFIGSTNNEEFLHKKETTQLFKKTADQLANKTDLRNEIRILEEFEGMVFITHFFDAWFLNGEEWSYYGRFRFSSIARRNKEGWRFIYQHFSMPDSRAEEGETIGFDQISAENLQLREAIKRRTIELENRNRDLEIERSLERVRTVSMSMRHSSELAKIGEVIFEELKSLGFSELRNSEIVFNQEHKDELISYYYSDYGVSGVINIEVKGNPVLEKWVAVMKKADDAFAEVFISEKEMEEWRTYRDSLGYLPDPKLMAANNLFYYSYSIDLGALSISSFSALSPEELKILQRFRNVFNLSYQRYVDIEKAEAQARESQIELGLERVRARAMAMQNSEELKELIGTVFGELIKLDLKLTRCAIWVFNKGELSARLWLANSEDPLKPGSYFLPYHQHEAYLAIVDAWKQKKLKWVYNLEGSNKKTWDEYLFLNTEFARLPDHVKAGMSEPEQIHLSFTFGNFGGIHVSGLEPLSEDHFDILHRFGKVFDLTYTRFNDLKQAEAQAREAQIELALERIRAQALAMRESSDLLDIVVTMRMEFIKLGHEAHYFWHMRWLPEKYEKAMTSGDGTRIGMVMELPRHMHGDIPLLATWEKSREPTVIYAMEVQAAVDYVNKMISLGDFKQVDPNAPSPDDIRQIGGLTFVMARTTHGEIGYSLPGKFEDIPESDLEILIRFAGAFDLAHRRFEDLQKAESQAREAQIENALEKVRSRTMAMQRSEELPEAANNLFLQVQGLGIPAWSAGYCIWEKEDKKAALCCMSSEGEIQKSFILPSIGEGYDFYHPAQKGDSFYVHELGGEALVEHYEFMRTLPTVGQILDDLTAAGLSLPTFQIFHIVYFPHGYLMFITYEEVPQAHEIFRRFGKVFEQTYTRFLDLQQAEARARESQIETALERVRSRTMGMQRSDELGQVATVLFRELNRLVDNLWTCGFVLCEEGRDEDEWWLSAENGFIPAFYLPNVGDVTHNNIYNAWRNGADYHTEQLEGDALQEHYDWLMKIPVAKQIFDDMKAAGIEIPTWQKLHCAFFKTGYLVIITQVPCAEEEIFKRFAQAFDLTYTRFLDLQLKETQARKLAEDKEQLERTLSDLKATQAQLIQSEKMASLGELTAGIAHEIQNPLNFVNNFSEVSKELIEEMLEEIQKGDMEEARALAEDVVQNLEKIHHHGQRADGIVKGMLQHSRSGSGEKEPTDLNALADEYLRLAYHGLRAKDKSFNASLETHFDPDVGKVSVVAQDMGRVILNLITNAFYAVKEKKEKEREGYTPTVTVTTRKKGDGVEVSVGDNGDGIPKAIREKIFQPFFTTKPTGQGTGLGLSMSYDIVTKLHLGELLVTSEERKGTTFTVILPAGIKA
ncbi:His Kinase A (phospho-acceptor) domain-containing protein [Muriicola jejuensis]|uniref:histidine kinase n=1 Tax=Muriicola jejuensis TaxID=504488 RepID=A0A6P0U971_9FLAO|nr:ATP-binding protein [Muriicola jejuensis]NER09704.1 hypothetical protein [Muriicola jejuensis]SMP06425.1 His Kinase A (phospho-acceptor) domain-containing protein [Muriicola jejuensis]